MKLLAKLKISKLTTSVNVKRDLLNIVGRNLNAFAGSAHDFGRTFFITHTIKTGYAKPFQNKLRLILYAHCQYIDKDLEKLLSMSNRTGKSRRMPLRLENSVNSQEG